jgi:hypothetical protein
MTSSQLVTKSSAVVPGMVNVEAIAINKDHVGLAKFSSSEDDDFQTVCGHLVNMVSIAPQKIAEKWRLNDVSTYMCTRRKIDF